MRIGIIWHEHGNGRSIASLFFNQSLAKEQGYLLEGTGMCIAANKRIYLTEEMTETESNQEAG